MSDKIVYKSDGIKVEKAPISGENLMVYARPGDKVNIDFDTKGAEYKLVGGDIILALPNGGVVTFVSMGIMALEGDSPVIGLKDGQVYDSATIINNISEIIESPQDSTVTSSAVLSPDQMMKKEEGEIDEALAKKIEEMQAFIQDLSKKSVSTAILMDELSGLNSATSDMSASMTKSADPMPVVQNLMPKNDFNSKSTASFSERTVYKEDIREIPDTSHLVEPPKVEMMPKNDFDGYSGEGWGDGYGDSYNTGPGQVNDAAKPVFYFKATTHQVKQSDPAMNADGQLEVKGGGGSLNGYKFDSITNQFEPEVIDMSQKTENMIVRAEDSSYFSGDPSDIYLSKVLRFEPDMPEGFYVESFTLSGLPSGVKILDKNGNELSGSSVGTDDMIFKDDVGNIIDFNDPDFITKFKSAEFIIKYDDSIPAQFDISITANYKLDSSYAGTTDLNPSQSYTNDYTFLLKTVTSADDYAYNKENVADGKDEGFVLNDSTNYNIIKDGSGNSTIYGGIVKDVVYDGAGDDTIYLSAGSDTVYGGSGTNYIYGDSDGEGNDYSAKDLVSYEEVQSFGLSELKVMYQNGLITADEYAKLSGTYEETDGSGNVIPNSFETDMLAYYKGVYVDLDGFHYDELNIDVNGDGTIDSNDKINALSKFANRVEKFTYDDDGNAIATTLTDTGLDALQGVGYDIYQNIENINGSNYNDTIYGNTGVNNVLSGLGGSDIIDGRGGNNTLLGGAGYDTLISGSGDDFIDGGTDTDAVSYQNATGGVIVRLDRPNGEEYDYATGYGNDTIVNIEDIIGSDYVDTIFGNGGTNFIQGGGSNDSIFAGGGYDFIDGGAGSDWITYNPADYPNRTTNPNFMEEIQGITVDLNSGDFVMLKETATGRLIDLVKSVEQIRATEGVDRIYGGSASEVFWTFGGNDRIESRGGNDTIYAGDGNDYVRPGAGNDTSYGGEGIDYLELYDDGLSANQTLRLDESGTIQYHNGAAWVDGYNGNGGVNLAYEFEGFGASNNKDIMYGNSGDNTLNAHNGNDTVYGLGGDDVINGGNDDDLLYGDDIANTLSGDDTLIGGNGNDTMYGGKGDDLFYGSIRYDASPDSDTYHGGEGVDTLDYSRTNHNYNMTVTMTGGGDGTVSFAGLADVNYQDTFTSIERFIASRGNDVINGDDSGMYLDGWSGKDTIIGGSGDDTIVARNTSGETLDGGGGTDTLQLAQNVDFRNQSIEDFEILELGSYRAYFTYSQFFADNAFSAITGSANSRLDIYGTNADEVFDFSSVDLSGFLGTIYATGGNGNDTFVLGDDGTSVNYLLDGGGGSDTLELGSNATIAMTDNYYNTFESFDIANDATLNVTAYNNNGRSFYAHNKDFSNVDGEINLIGGSGNDYFYADYQALSDGKIKVDGGAGSDMVDVRTTISGDTLTFDSADSFANIERLEIDQANTRNNDVKIDATVVNDWIGNGDTLTLDIYNNTQGSRITIENVDSTTSQNSTTSSSYDGDGVAVNNSYSIDTTDVDASENFTLAVV